MFKKTLILILSSILSTSCAMDSSTTKAAFAKFDDPKLTESWGPVPAVVSAYPVPSDAIVLFDGTDLEQWKGHRGKPEWNIDGDIVTTNPGTGGIATKQKFCDIQLHIEWRSPEKERWGKGQALGNSGVFLQGKYEVQILDSYQNETYVNGQAASIYKQSAPLVNATAKTGDWNSYDIIFKSPRFDDAGKLVTPAIVTVLHNGILVQDHFEIQGKTGYRGRPYYKPHGCESIYIQDHKDKVSFRNIWVREL